MKEIWSSNGELGKLVNASPEEKRAYLTDLHGGDTELINQLDDDQLNDYISNNMDIYNNAAEDFEDNIAPVIADQVDAGLVLDENFNLVDPSVLLNYNGYSATLDEDENGELWFNVEGRKPFPILGFSPEPDDFIWQLSRLGILDTIHDLYPDWADEDIDVYDIADLIPFNWALLEEVLTRPAVEGWMDAKENVNVDEAVSTKNVKGLAKELSEIKKIVDSGSYRDLADKPFTFNNGGKESIEYEFPEFYNIAYNFFKEMDFNKDKSETDPEKQDEFKYLKENDPERLEDMLEDLWYAIDKTAWDTIVEMCEILIKKKGATTQAKDVYKKHYKSVLDDDQILADRKAREAEFEESLNEGLSDDNSRYFSEYIDPIAEESDLRVSKDPIDGGVEISVTSYDGMWAEYDFLDSGKVIVRGEAIDDPPGELEFNSYEEFAKWQDSIGAWDEDGEGTVLKSYKRSLKGGKKRGRKKSDAILWSKGAKEAVKRFEKVFGKEPEISTDKFLDDVRHFVFNNLDDNGTGIVVDIKSYGIIDWKKYLNNEVVEHDWVGVDLGSSRIIKKKKKLGLNKTLEERIDTDEKNDIKD